MDVISSAWTYMQEFNALGMQDEFFQNVDVVSYTIAFYVMFIVKGPQWLGRLFGGADSAAPASSSSSSSSSSVTNGITVVQTPGPREALLDRFMVVWRLLMTAVPMLTLAHILPVWFSAVQKHGTYEAACVWNDKLVHTGPVALWMGMYTISKIPAMLDAFFVVLQNHLRGSSDTNHPRHKRIPFYEWYHHSLLLAYSWHTFIIGTSFFVVFVMLNALAQTVVWMCKLQLDVEHVRSGLDEGGTNMRRKTKGDRLRAYITTAYVAECITGTVLAIYGSYQNYHGPRGCMVMQANMRMCMAMYISCLYYIISDVREAWKKTAAAAAGPEAKKRH